MPETQLSKPSPADRDSKLGYGALTLTGATPNKSRVACTGIVNNTARTPPHADIRIIHRLSTGFCMAAGGHPGPVGSRSTSDLVPATHVNHAGHWTL
jgi:hypothetical protein